MADLILKEYDKKLHTIYLKGTVDEDMWQSLVDKISEIKNADNEIEKSNKEILEKFGLNDELFWQNNKIPDINIYLSTFGGDVYDMLGIYDEIKNLNKDYDVNIYCSGKVMSAGTIIMLAVPLEQRFSYSNTTFMYHDLSGGVEGKVKEMEEYVEETKRIHKIMLDIYLQNTKLPKEKLQEIIYKTKKDWYINSKQAISYEVISKII